MYKSVQSIAGQKTPYKDWFEALEKMKNDIAKIDFDVAIIGCGAYGLPLAGYIKEELHKKSIHIGGGTQLLFGIKGKDGRKIIKIHVIEICSILIGYILMKMNVLKMLIVLKVVVIGKFI